MIVAHVSGWQAFWATVILAAFLICCCAMFIDFNLKYRQIRDTSSDETADVELPFSQDAA